MTKSGISAIRLALWGLVLLALIVLLWFRVIAPRLEQDVTASLGRGDYELTATDGSAFTEDSLKGAPSAVFFGFTHCPEVCPTTLGDIATWEEGLGSDAAALRVFFVTVDPERDTVEQLRDYVSWVPEVRGVSGSRADIDKALKAFRIYARRVPLDDGGYTMDHSAMVLLFDARGDYAGLINYQEEYDRALGKLQALVAGS
ncbi:SCO family protein [Salipiger sp. PrR002]|uniref:SCO family protein n=1 Tax=Salipiger sp. PrR002 TaxID=2706489 RepID=UPI0013B7F797|nr:SCO family protein [Salipiger sp. PrR002]NDV99649.1 SCO family protein [Salipiger sp. PrR002]NDW56753.1 SCO family protein [Salipiger sp. PrR004]